MPNEPTILSDVEMSQFRQYLQRLIDQLGTDLMALSGTGIELPEANRVTLMLQQHQPMEDRERGFSHIGSEGEGAVGPHTERVALTPERDLELLEKWSKTQRKPLLILAPFGSGKSVLLAAFAVSLARQGLKQINENQFPLRVPWPVRLRSWPQYRNDHPKAKFRDFTWASAASLLCLEEGEETLPLAVFDRLLNGGWLVPLFDGFDELPDEYFVKGLDPADAPSRKNVLQAMRKCCNGCGFVLSSRPGSVANATVAGFSETDQHILNELSPRDMQAYIHKRFGGQPQLLKRAERALTKPRPNVANLLRRPLFLASWCDLVRPDADPPSRVTNLMTELVIRCFDGRRQELRLNPDELREILPELESLLFHFASAGFGTVVAESEIKERLEAEPGGLKMERLAAIRGLAVAAGFLVEIGATQWYAIKVPVTEFLAAQHLVRLAGGTAEELQRLIHTFQRWVWVLELHDALDMLFAMLGEGSKKEGELAEGFIEWLCKVSAAESSRNLQASALACDDLARPFVFAAIRWISLLERRSELCKGAFETLGNVLPKERNILKQLEKVLRSSEWYQEMVPPCMSLLIAAYHAPDAGDKRDWIEAIEAAADCVSGDRAVEIVQQLIAAHHVTEAKDKWVWLRAIRKAAGCVGDTRAAEIVERWIAAHHLAEKVDKKAWREAANEAARCVGDTQAAEIIQRWITAHHAAGGKDKRVWMQAISKAAGRVREDQAAEIVQQLLAAYHTVKAGNKTAWIEAIHMAAGRVHENQAVEIVQQLISAYHAVKPGDKGDWSGAIGAAAQRVSEDRTTEIVQRWIAADNAATVEDKAAWRAALSEVAKHVGEDRAAEITQQLIAIYAAKTGDSSSLDKAIWNAAKRVGETRAAEFIRQWIAAYHVADVGDKDAWIRAISGAVERVNKVQAAEIVPQLFAARHKAKATEKEAWISVIRETAEHVSEDQAAKIVQQWIAAYHVADVGDKDAWTGAIWAAAKRVHEDQAAEIVQQLIAARHKVEATDEEAWIRTIWAAAERVREDQAAEIVHQLLAAHDAAEGWKQVWIGVISAAAGRVREDQAAEIIHQLLVAHDTAEAMNKEAWIWAIKAAATRVGEDRITEIIQKLCEAYNVAEVGNKSTWIWALRTAAGQARGATAKQAVLELLLKNRWLEEAVNLARQSETSTIVSVIGQSQATVEVAATGRFEARLRNDPTLLLDENLEVAPESIRKVMAPEPEANDTKNQAVRVPKSVVDMIEKMSHTTNQRRTELREIIVQTMLDKYPGITSSKLSEVLGKTQFSEGAIRGTLAWRNREGEREENRSLQQQKAGGGFADMLRIALMEKSDYGHSFEEFGWHVLQPLLKKMKGPVKLDLNGVPVRDQKAFQKQLLQIVSEQERAGHGSSTEISKAKLLIQAMGNL